MKVSLGTVHKTRKDTHNVVPGWLYMTRLVIVNEDGDVPRVVVIQI